MKAQRLAVWLTSINLVLLLGLVLSLARPVAAGQEGLPLLRGRGLEIVDARGRVRASITLLPPPTAGEPEGVLLRLIDSRGGPVVKLGASENGSGLNLADGTRHFSGVQILAIDTGSLVRVRNPDGAERLIKP